MRTDLTGRYNDLQTFNGPPVFGAMDEDLDASQGAEAWPKVGGDGEEITEITEMGGCKFIHIFFFGKGLRDAL